MALGALSGHGRPGATEMEHIVFLTGRLAEPALRRVLGGLASQTGDAPFTWEVREIGLQPE